MPGEVRSAPLGIAVYCGSSLGKEKAFQLAAISIGKAIGTSGRSLVYGGGKMGLMGVVSGAVMEAGGHAIGVRPYAMVAAGGEKEKAAAKVADDSVEAALQKHQDQQYEQIVVNTMQERKTEMAKRSAGFIALPGGFGTWEEFCEAGTWTQLAIHQKPIILINVLGFYDYFRMFIQKSLDSGFIQPQNVGIFVFVDAPSDDPAFHETFDWGAAALAALDGWKVPPRHSHTFDWTLKKPESDGQQHRQAPLDAI